MQNYHFGMAKTIIGESGPGSALTEAEPAELAKAQVRATLAVADPYKCRSRSHCQNTPTVDGIWQIARSDRLPSTIGPGDRV